MYHMKELKTQGSLAPSFRDTHGYRAFDGRLSKFRRVLSGMSINKLYAIVFYAVIKNN